MPSNSPGNWVRPMPELGLGQAETPVQQLPLEEVSAQMPRDTSVSPP